MSLCDQCVRLTLAPMRNDVPIHLNAYEPSTGQVAAAIRVRGFDCEICNARWDWKNVSGWYLETLNRCSDRIRGSDYAIES